MGIIASKAQATHVFVIDDSVSMGQKIADTTALAKAASDLADMLPDIPATDRLAIVLPSHPGGGGGFQSLTAPRANPPLASRLKALRPSDTAGGLDKALQTAGEILGQVASAKRLYVL